MRWQQPGKELGEKCRDPVVERGVRIGLPGELGQQPMTVSGHVEDNADGDGVVVFPGVVSDQADENVEREQNGQCPATRRERDSLETRMILKEGHGNPRNLLSVMKKAAARLPFCRVRTNSWLRGRA